MASQHESLIFTNGFRSKARFKLNLEDKELCIIWEGEDEKKTRRLKYEDITGVGLGVECSKPSGGGGGDSEANPTMITHSINIYSYPSTKTIFSSKYSRKRSCATLLLNSSESSDRNKEALTSLKDDIEHRIHSCKGGPGTKDRFNKPMLVLLNPASGKRLARKQFKEKITPMFKEAHVEFEVMETERAGHGTEIALHLDLSKYYGLVIMSGDGLLYEVYQGLMARADSSQAVKIPIGILPAGSGNALCCSINYDAGEPFLYDMMIHSAFILLKHTLRPMDLVAIDTTAGRLYSFLSVTWGMIADVDIESERFRNLGSARFTIEALYRIAKPRTYKGRLSFLPNCPYVYKGRSRTEVDIIDQQPESENTERVRSASLPSGHPVSDIPDVKATANSAHVDDTTDETAVNEYDLPALDQPVPENWVTIEDNFMTVAAAYLSHLGADSMVTPAAAIQDGLIYLLIIRAPVTRMQMLNIMTQFESGSHVKNRIVELVAVKAFRLEPGGVEGNLVVDGEKVPYGPIQGKIMPAAARIMAK